jgi:hypothetical protein
MKILLSSFVCLLCTLPSQVTFAQLSTKGSVDTIQGPVTGPKYEEKTFNDTLKIKTRANVSGNSIKFELSDGSQQTITFPNQSGSHYKLFLRGIRTKLKSQDATITSYCYVPLTGGILAYAPKGIGIEADGTLNLDVYIHTGHHMMTGNLVVYYTVSHLVCVEDCL